MEVCVKILKFCFATIIFSILFLFSGINSATAQLKIGYINSNKILETYQEAIDVKKKLQDINQQWEREAKEMQTELQDLQEQLEAQSLLLSEEKKQEKAQEIQNKYIKYQQFVNQKWGQQGEAVKEEAKLLDPVFKKINAAIKKIGETENYHYIFDTVAANILYASDDQPDLTKKLLEELNKGLPAKTNTGGK